MRRGSQLIGGSPVVLEYARLYFHRQSAVGTGPCSQLPAKQNSLRMARTCTDQAPREAEEKEKIEREKKRNNTMKISKLQGQRV